MSDPLASSAISSVLAWIIAIPLFFGVIVGITSFITESLNDRNGPSSRLVSAFRIYYFACLLVISPFRYMMLQFLIFNSFVVQSLSAAMSGAIAATYGLVLFLVTFAVLIVLPHTLLFGALNSNRQATSWGAAVLTPITFAMSYALFFLILPYVGWTFHWLGAKDVVRSANGPASVFFKLVVEPDIPRIGPKLEAEHGDTAKERLRAHVAQIYVSEFKRTKMHLSNSLYFVRSMNDVASQRQGMSVSSIPPGDIQSIVVAYRAALSQAEKVDARILDARFPQLGTMFEEKYIPGLKAILSTLEDGGHTTANPDHIKMQEWARWYNVRVDEIWDAL